MRVPDGHRIRKEIATKAEAVEYLVRLKAVEVDATEQRPLRNAPMWR